MDVARDLGRYSVHAVGILLFVSGFAYLLLREEPLLVASAKTAFPILLGMVIVGYGIWLRRTGMSAFATATVAIVVLLGGATFAFVSGWLLYVMSIEFAMPEETGFVVLNGVAIGTVIGGFLGTLFVSLQERQQMLRERNAELRRQNERLDQFASIVSHDLRNPLNVAQGRLELARETGEETHFEALAGALDRMNAIISDMLAFARQGRAVENPEKLELADLAERAWNDVDTDDVQLSIESNVVLEAHESRLVQALENLFRNAWEHGGEDISTVWVGTVDGGGGFYVEDDGVGIPETNREKVFESGYTSTEAGTGFGLAIVEAVVEAHGWTIDLVEGRNGGARFQIEGVETE